VTSSEFSNVLLTLAVIQLVILIVIVNTWHSPVPEGQFLGITYGIPKPSHHRPEILFYETPVFSKPLVMNSNGRPIRCVAERVNKWVIWWLVLSFFDTPNSSLGPASHCVLLWPRTLSARQALISLWRCATTAPSSRQVALNCGPKPRRCRSRPRCAALKTRQLQSRLLEFDLNPDYHKRLSTSKDIVSFEIVRKAMVPVTGGYHDQFLRSLSMQCKKVTLCWWREEMIVWGRERQDAGKCREEVDKTKAIVRHGGWHW